MSQGNIVAIAALDTKVALADAGPSSALLRIYDGPVPARVDDALGSNTQLAELVMSDPAFGAAYDTDPHARADANPITDDTSADASGTASFYRIFDSDLVPRFQGTVGLVGSGEPLEMNTLEIRAGSPVKVSSLGIVEYEN